MRCLTIIVLSMTLMQTIADRTIEADFKLCETNKQDEQIRETECDQFHANEPLKYQQDSPEEIYLLEKSHDAIYGTGWECKKEQIVVWANKSWTTSETTNSYSILVHLRPEECWNMVRTMTCEMRKMDCDDNSCVTEFVPSPVYKYPKDVSYLGYKCSFKKRNIRAEHKDEGLFSKTGPPCLAQHHQCYLHDSIVVWNDDIIHECPYKLANIVKNVSKISASILYSQDPLFFLTINDAFYMCAMKIFKSNEGFFVSFSNISLHLDRAESSEDLMRYSNYANTAEIDALQFQNQKQAIDLYMLKQEIKCQTFNMYIQIMRTLNDRFFQISIDSNKTIVIYSFEGLLYIPKCQKLNYIFINNDNQEENKECYKYLPVRFRNPRDNKTFIYGYLTDNNIIRTYSPKTDCLLINQHYTVNDDEVINREGNNVKIKSIRTKKIFKDIGINNLGAINFHHLGLINESFSLTNKDKQFIIANEIKETELAVEKVILQNKLFGPLQNLIEFFNSKMFIVFAVLVLIIVIFVAIFAIIIRMQFYK